MLSSGENSVAIDANNVTLVGGAGDDVMDIDLSATVTSSGIARIGRSTASNVIRADGGSGADTIEIELAAKNEGGGFGLGATISNNLVNNVTGGADDDSITLNFTATASSSGDHARIRGNQINPKGGTGDDTIAVTLNASARLTADIISNNIANTQGTATNASHRFIYDTVAMKLLYDADGTGTGAAEDVATFDADLALMASDIKSTGGIGP